MRRTLAAAVLAAFVGTLGCGVAVASPAFVAPAEFSAPTGLSDAYAMQTFGRVPSDEQPFSTPVGIASPLHGLAFAMYRNVPNAIASADVAPALPAVPQIALTFARVFTINDAVARYDDGPSLPATQTVAVADTGASPARALFSRGSFVRPHDAFGDASTFDGVLPSFDSRLRDDATAVSIPLRAGAVAWTDVQLDAQFADQRTQENRLLADTTITPRIAGYPVHLNFGTSYAYLSNGHGEGTALPSADFDAPAANLPGGSASLASSLTNVTARGVNAGVAVPIAHNLSFGVQYGTQRFTGEYTPSFEPVLDASRYQYLGNVTLKLPRSSSLTLSAQQYRYQDNLTPTNTYTGTRADLNYTVKF